MTVIITTLERIDDIRSDNFADDVDITDDMQAWSEDELVTYFTSGGTERPAAKPTASTDANKTAPVDVLDGDNLPSIAEEEPTIVPTGAAPVQAPAAAAPVADVEPASDADAAECIPCEDQPAGWSSRDPRLLAFLDGCGLLKAAEALATTKLSELEGLSRVDLLATLKTAGVGVIADRQKFANALSRAMKEGTLPTDGCARPDEPPPTCDKCDGKHKTDACPHFKKAREEHPDAKAGGGRRSLLGNYKGPEEVLRPGQASVMRQPGDGSCLFHSLAHGLADGSSASSLRRAIAQFVESNEELSIADSPLKDWVRWDSVDERHPEGMTVSEYCKRMISGNAWGGGIEMAAASHLKGVKVIVYETVPNGGGYKRIGTFEPPAKEGGGGGVSALYAKRREEVRVIYQGGVHYDALVLATHGLAASTQPSAYGASNYYSAAPYNGIGSAHREAITARGGGRVEDLYSSFDGMGLAFGL